MIILAMCGASVEKVFDELIDDGREMICRPTTSFRQSSPNVGRDIRLEIRDSLCIQIVRNNLGVGQNEVKSQLFVAYSWEVTNI